MTVLQLKPVPAHVALYHVAAVIVVSDYASLAGIYLEEHDCALTGRRDVSLSPITNNEREHSVYLMQETRGMLTRYSSLYGTPANVPNSTTI